MLGLPQYVVFEPIARYPELSQVWGRVSGFMDGPPFVAGLFNSGCCAPFFPRLDISDDPACAVLGQLVRLREISVPRPTPNGASIDAVTRG